MRTALASILLVLSTAHTSLAAEPARPRWSHTRPLTPGAATLLTRAAERSTILRTQLEAIEQTDVVVYVLDSMSRSVGDPKASLEFVATAGGRRYVVVRVDRWSLNPSEALAWFGHELQHAIEVASAPEVTNAAQLARLYRRIGWEYGSGQFESDAAQTAGHRVRNELAGLRY
jgi:signal transduction histidine kinase